MPQQPNLFSPRQSPAPAPAAVSAQAPRWLRRTELLVRVLVRLYVGILLVFLPWMRTWTENRLLTLSPHLAVFAFNGAIRGIVSGLGLLNLWIAFSDAFGYKED